MKAVKYHLSLALIASIFVGCDLFFPYTLEDAPEVFLEVPKGAFSVAGNKYVYFSSGNLQYNEIGDIWRFAPNQYDYIGSWNESNHPSYNGWIDLFAWGTGENPTTSYSSDHFIDWGVNKIGNDDEGIWRTLTEREWGYILYRRKNASLLQGLARIVDVNGLILLPDDWESPSGITFNSGVGGGFSQNVYNASKWQMMEEAGAIFLPAAGRDVSYISGIGETGCYWSSSSYYENWSDYFYLDFTSSNVGMSHGDSYGYSVRLVR